MSRAQRLSPESFLTLYAASGIAGSLLSAGLSAARGVSVPSLGASGAVLGALTYYLLHNPDARMWVMGVEMSGSQTHALNVGLNTLGAVYSMRRGGGAGGVDWAAHVGGIASGWAYAEWRARQRPRTARAW